jgi:hypothetical protein
MNIILPFLINNDIKEEIVSFTQDGINYFTKNLAGNNRRYCNLNKINVSLTDMVEHYSEKLFEKLNFTDTREEPNFGNFIGVNSQNAFVHSHKDSKSEHGFFHVRINFLVQKPISGGMPVINNKIYVIEENQSWLNLASEWTHSSTPVIGIKERIVLSLGKYVNPNQIKGKYD